ncbi:unnamed protein product [Clonostachys rosea f. rosea IK726]|uniref:Uncharacterized protein n=1 Tax=Clonostachys rosea f. rosea IK726 TaxID=1349383 RepID=A0ACA9UC83_BIOOC|nr:unnamed protein product [Clonostachys rosea f. rosea IK726]
MASIPPAPDPAVAAAFEVSDDIELYIRVDEAEREQPADCTYRPTKPAATQRGTRFDPFSVDPIRKPQIQELPLTPLLLFQEFIYESLAKSWASYTNYRLPAKKEIIVKSISETIGIPTSRGQ